MSTALASTRSLVAHTTLDRLNPGQRCVVTAIAGALPVRRRLLEMGLGVDIEIEVLRRAPLGDPIEFGVRGYLLSLRCEQASLVSVRASVKAAAKDSREVA